MRHKPYRSRPKINEGRRKDLKKRWKRWISLLSVIALVFCFFPPVSADQNESIPYVNISSLPDNIRLLLDLEPEKTSPSGQRRSAAVPLRVRDTDDPNSILVEDAGGNGTAKVFGVPIRYEDEAGEMRFIDTSMTAENPLTILFGGYDYRNTANNTSFQFSKKPEKGIQVDEAFTLAVHNPDNAKLPQGYTDQTAEGNGRMTYPKAFGEHTYVEYINTNTGLKENIILEQNIGRNRFDFIFESEEYIPVLSADGLTIRVVHKSNAAEEVYHLTSLYVYDSYKPDAYDTIEEEPSREPVLFGPGSEGYEAPADEQEGPAPIRHYTEDNYYEVERLAEGKYRITSVVSEEFLNSPDTVYPVTIDPSFTGSNSNAQDSYVWENNPNTNYGSLEYLRFGKSSGGMMYSYFRFNQLPTLPDKVNITNATLKFTFRSGQTSGANGVCKVVEAKQWSESSITWNNQPYGQWGYTSSHNNYQYYNFYVKPYTDMWYNGDYQNYGICFTYSNMINDYNSVVSTEGEAGRAPTLTITYVSAPILGTSTTYNATLEWAGHNWYKFTPSTSGNYVFSTTGSTDTYGELYQGYARIATNDDGGPGSNFEITYNLTANVAYYIKVRGYNRDKTGNYSLRVMKEKKAIIIIPGIMGSELYAHQAISIPGGTNLANGTRLWDPSIPELTIAGDKIRGLKCDANGTPLYSTGIKGATVNKTANQMQGQYGAQNVYQNLYEELYTQFYPAYDIVLFEYDWRKSLDMLAGQLDFFINNSMYNKVVLIAHSMGGLVAAQYLVNEDRREDVERYISVGAPYLGAVLPIGIYLDGRFLRGNSLKGDMIALVGNIAVQNGVKEVFPNISTFYSLLPPSQSFSAYLSYGNCAAADNGYFPGIVKGQYTTYTDTMNYLSTGLSAWNATLMQQAQTVSNKAWINGQHVTTLLGSRACFIVGTGDPTPVSIECFTPSSSSRIMAYRFVETNGGDGTVPLWSATIGGATGNRTFYKDPKGKYNNKGVTVDHLGMIKGKYEGDAIGITADDFSTIHFITQIIKGNENAYANYAFSRTLP